MILPDDAVKNTQNIGFVLPDGQSVLGVILALTAILTAGGYTVTQVHLNRFTSITSYSVVPAQFLAAGFSLAISTVVALAFALLLGVTLEIFSSETKVGKRVNAFIHSRFYKTESIYSPEFYAKLPFFTSLLLALVSSFVVILLLLLRVPISTSIINISGFIAVASALPLLPAAVFFEKKPQASEVSVDLNRKQDILLKVSVGLIVGLIVGLGLLVYVMVIGWSYSSSVYGLIPRSLGGGQPVSVSVAFRNAEAAESLGLMSNDQDQVENVCLLAELIDGILIYDPAQQTTVVIQTGSDSEVLGYFDDRASVDCNPPSNNSFFASRLMDRNPEATEAITPEITPELTVPPG